MKVFILVLFFLNAFNLNPAFAEPPEPIDPLSPVPIPGTKKVIERPRFRIPHADRDYSIIIGFQKPATTPVFGGNQLRRHASIKALVGGEGRILDARPDITYNCHSHALGQPIGLPRI